jgi:hypothetical protein
MYIGNEKEPTNITSSKGYYLINERHLILIDDVKVSKPSAQQVLFSDRLSTTTPTRCWSVRARSSSRGPG